ncbi:MAG: hypothetical protein CMH82_07375 [Nocardioides sp.]|nr:hypothetical protein [Nocardioides sp.]
MWGLDQGILDIQAQEVADSPLSVMLVSRDDRVLPASGRVRALLGRDDEELVGRRARDVLVASGAERQRLALQTLMSGGEVGGGSRHWEGDLRGANRREVRVRVTARRTGLTGADALWCAIDEVVDDGEHVRTDAPRGTSAAVPRPVQPRSDAAPARPAEPALRSEGHTGAAPVEATLLMELVDAVSRHPRRGAHLVEDVLHMTAVQAGTMAVATEPCHVRGAVLAAVSDRAGTAVRHKVGFDLALDEAPTVAADPVLLRKCVDQIIGNAVKFTAPHGSVICTWRVDEDFLVLRVANPAGDADQEVVDRAFDPWADGTAAVHDPRPGVGLGLVVARGLARLMRGDVALRLSHRSGSAPVVHCELRLPLA